MNDFIAIPSRFITCVMQDLHGAEIKILLLLFASGALQERIEITMEALSDRTGLSRRAVSDAVSDLERRDHIVRTRTKGGSHVYTYKIRNPDDTPPQIVIEVGTDAHDGKPDVSEGSEMDALVRIVAPMVPASALREYVSNDRDVMQLLACLRDFNAKGHSYADVDLFLRAVSHYYYEHGWR